jgi:hemerythrin-like domain-containing protein
LDEYLNRGIKEIIDQFPLVETILENFEIGCAPCNVGTCQLRDIVEIHNLTEEQEKHMLTEMFKIFYPGQTVKLPQMKKRSPIQGDDKNYSPPMKILVKEHLLIKRLIALFPAIRQSLDVTLEKHQTLIRQCVDFIRSYADTFHHAKEEDILFTYFDAELDILKVILSDHESGRAHVKAMLAGLEEKDTETVSRHLGLYGELLTEHIKKEDDILYPWMDRILEDKHIGTMYAQFNETDAQFGDAPQKYEKLIVELESQYKN